MSLLLPAASPEARARARARSVRAVAYRGFVLIVLAMAGIFASLVFGIVELTKAGNTLRADIQMQSDSALAQRSVIDLETGLRGYLLTHQRDFLAPYHAALRLLPEPLGRLKREIREPALARQLTTLIADIAAYERGYAAPLAASDGRLTHGQAIVVTAEGKRLVDALRARFAGLTPLSSAWRRALTP